MIFVPFELNFTSGQIRGAFEGCRPRVISISKSQPRLNPASVIEVW